MIRKYINHVAVPSQTFVHLMEKGGLIDLPKPVIGDLGYSSYWIKAIDIDNGILLLQRIDQNHSEIYTLDPNMKYYYFSPEEQQYNESLVLRQRSGETWEQIVATL